MGTGRDRVGEQAGSPCVGPALANLGSGLAESRGTCQLTEWAPEPSTRDARSWASSGHPHTALSWQGTRCPRCPSRGRVQLGMDRAGRCAPVRCSHGAQLHAVPWCPCVLWMPFGAFLDTSNPAGSARTRSAHAYLPVSGRPLVRVSPAAAESPGYARGPRRSGAQRWGRWARRGIRGAPRKDRPEWDPGFLHASPPTDGTRTSDPKAWRGGGGRGRHKDESTTPHSGVTPSVKWGFQGTRGGRQVAPGTPVRPGQAGC